MVPLMSFILLWLILCVTLHDLTLYSPQGAVKHSQWLTNVLELHFPFVPFLYREKKDNIEFLELRTNKLDKSKYIFNLI